MDAPSGIEAYVVLLCLVKKVKKVATRFRGIAQKRSLSQVFLAETWPCTKMVSQLVSQGVSSVIEIGPGGGVLTKELLGAGFDVLAIEKDSRFAEQLPGQFEAKGSQIFEVENADFLSYDIEPWLKKDNKMKAICGNIPYSISTPILAKLLPDLGHLKSITILVQLEFAKRVAAAHGNKDFGSLSVFCQLRARTNLDFMVPKTCFSPVPKVDSAVVSLFPLKENFDEKLLQKAELICRAAFMQRRKKLSNSLENLIRNEGIEMGDLPVDLTKRAENLSPQDYLALAKFISAQKS